MPYITLIDRSGTASVIDAAEGVSLMEAIRQSGQDQLMALCGGVCSCATCHIYIENGAADQPHDDESDLLDSSDHRRCNSRLSCQIIIDGSMNGLVARIAPED